MSPAEIAGFLGQFQQCREDIKRLKESTPHLFHEWQALKAAEASLLVAQLKLAQAQRRWEAL